MCSCCDLYLADSCDRDEQLQMPLCCIAGVFMLLLLLPLLQPCQGVRP
jgi:hypothetical protein